MTEEKHSRTMRALSQSLRGQACASEKPEAYTVRSMYNFINTVLLAYIYS